MSLFKRRHPQNPNRAEDEPDTDEEHQEDIDPQLRLRTVRTAASSIAEAGRIDDRTQRRKSRRKRGFFGRGSLKHKGKEDADAKAAQAAAEQVAAAAAAAPIEVPGLRRNVYVNVPLASDEVDPKDKGEPLARYKRNKVRTTKYTLVTFIPKNLYEQFGRVANLFFLGTVIVQLFPVFGAANGKLSMIPLVFILTVTAIKDGVEDYRRAALDEEVNTSPATKLTHWKNVNQPTDSRDWFEKLLGLNAPGKVTKGVAKLRAKEANQATIVLSKRQDSMVPSVNSNSQSIDDPHRLDDIQSVDEHSYPPAAGMGLVSSLSSQSMDSTIGNNNNTGNSRTNLMSDSLDYPPSAMSTSTAVPPSGSATHASVVNYSKRVSGVATWERTLWKKLEVGDIVLLREDEQVPADIVVLATSDADSMCYLETKNLDGETNLKARKSVRGTSGISSEADVERAAFVLDSEPPHQNLYVYNGVLRYTDPVSGEERKESVTINELLLRGCMLRNTTWAIGLVVFTGPDTKIMLNGGETPSKRSKIERETNFNVIMNFLVLVFMCAVGAIGSGLMDGKEDTSFKVFERGAEPTDSHVINAIVTFVSCLIAFQNIVPISLYISIEIVKTIQAYFIGQDIDMYYVPLDATCTPKTWNISDDLGQIEYVFSDKTGTLTQNVMEFQKCSVEGVTYGEGVTEAQRGAAQREGRAGELMSQDEQREHLAGLKESMLGKMGRAFKNRYAQPQKMTLIDPKLADHMAERNGTQRGHIIAFFRALAICHSVLADRPDPKDAFRVEYKAESPDEAALVAAARDAGFPFVGRTKDSIDIEVFGQHERYTPLKMLEFNSTRKRMSVVVRCPDGKIVLYCKGADSIIYQRLAKDHDEKLKADTARDMEAFANGGLRTLCIAYRVLSDEEYMNWSRVYDNATSAIADRDGEIDRANEMVEHSLTILGATALEDKLQEGVPEAIEMLHQAGIKLWILTGDKLQTAIEIGYSCNLLKSDMDIMIISSDSPDGARELIEAGLNKIASILGPPSLNPKERGFMPNAKASFAVVIDGDTLRHALEPGLKPLFLALGTQCETVVCCRVSPAQKALTVKLVKEGRNAMTLSIGDGANDVAMIQEANIGCGLFGLEGSQAAMSADYAFGQFRYLTKLLLVHGRWSYQRVAAMHCNFFYKNVVWTFALFWYLPFNSFDATYLYQYTFILLCNLLFTSLPVIALGAFDQDLNTKAALAYPQLYVRGIRGLEYTRTMFWLYMADGLYQSAIIYFIPWVIWAYGLTASWNGRGIESLSDFGTTVAIAAIWAANLYVGLNTNYWTVITWAVVFGSSILMMAWVTAYSFFESSDFVDEVIILFGGLTFWVTIVLAITLALLPRFIVKFVTTAFAPLDRDIVREAWVAGNLKDQLGIGHRKDKRNQRGGKSHSDLESTPIMKNPHLRSASEADPTEYVPVASTLPPDTGMSRSRSPMHSPGQEKGFRTPDNEDDAQYIVMGGGNGRSPGARSPGPHGIAGAASRLSYYSVSDIPPPSPAPAARYSVVPSRSHPSSPGGSASSRQLPPAQPSPLLAVGKRESYLNHGPQLSPGAPPSPHSYEMHVRGQPMLTPQGHGQGFAQALGHGQGGQGQGYDLEPPPSPYNRRDMSSASNYSFATAPEHLDGEEVDLNTPTAHRPQLQHGYSSQGPGGQGAAHPPSSWAAQAQPQGQGHDRPPSQTSWHGGVAM